MLSDILSRFLRGFTHDYLSLQHPTQTFSEEEFMHYRKLNCQNMQKPFLKFCLISLSILLFLRVFVLEFVNIVHSCALPICLVLLFWFFNERNEEANNLNVYLLIILVPSVVLIVAQKTISQSPALYHLNESFLSWLILLIYLDMISFLAWYQVTCITIGSFLLFYLRLVCHFGQAKIRNDLYIHFLTVIIIIAIIVRAKESLDRQQFQNLQII